MPDERICSECGNQTDNPRVIQINDDTRVFCEDCWGSRRAEFINALVNGDEKAVRIVTELLKLHDVSGIKKGSGGIDVIINKNKK